MDAELRIRALGTATEHAPKVRWGHAFVFDGAASTGRIHSLLRDRWTALPGMAIGPVVPPGAWPLGLSCDKPSYGPDEVVRVFVLAPGRDAVTLVVERRGRWMGRQRVALDARGCGMAHFVDLSPGDLVVRDLEASEPCCRFTVSSHRLTSPPAPTPPSAGVPSVSEDDALPVVVERLDGRTTKVTARVDLDSLVVVAVDALRSGERVERRADGFTAGETFVVSTPETSILHVFVGAFTPEPWEGATTLGPMVLDDALRVRETTTEEEVVVELELGASEATAFVEVRDANLATPTSLFEQLAAATAQVAEAASLACPRRLVTRTLADHPVFEDTESASAWIALLENMEGRHAARLRALLQTHPWHLAQKAEQPLKVLDTAIAELMSFGSRFEVEKALRDEVGDGAASARLDRGLDAVTKAGAAFVRVRSLCARGFSNPPSVAWEVGFDRAFESEGGGGPSAFERFEAMFNPGATRAMRQRADDLAWIYGEDSAGPAAYGEDAFGVSASTLARSPQPATEALYADVVETHDGRLVISFAHPERRDDLEVLVQVVTASGLATARKPLGSETGPRIALSTPQFLHPGDVAVGWVHVDDCPAGTRVAVEHEGRPVPLFDGDRAVDGRLSTTRAALRFAMPGPGHYLARLESPSARHLPRRETIVSPPGRLLRRERAVCCLFPGDQWSDDDRPDVVELRVLPNFDGPLDRLLAAVANDEHEGRVAWATQVFANAVALGTARDARARLVAETTLAAAVRAGSRRPLEPDPNTPAELFDGAVVERLRWALAIAAPIAGESLRASLASLRHAMECVARERALPSFPPEEPDGSDEAYAAVRFGASSAAQQRAVKLARGRAEWLLGGSARDIGAVTRRTEAAYGAATLLIGGGQADERLALRLANRALDELDGTGRLHSAIDSAAAIALLVALRDAHAAWRRKRLFKRLDVDGHAMALQDIPARGRRCRSVCSSELLDVAEQTREHVEDWSRFIGDVAVSCRLETNRLRRDVLAVGEGVNLVVELDDGYRAGDYVSVCLPPCLVWPRGGLSRRHFFADFPGTATVHIPLLAVAVTGSGERGPVPQRFAICIRNTFEQERRGSPGLQAITVVERADLPEELAREVATRAEHFDELRDIEQRLRGMLPSH